METKEILANHYGNYDEDGRLRSRHGMVEFLTTMRYVHKYLRPGMRISWDILELYRKENIDELRQQFPVAQIRFEATDGYSHHTLDIFRKDG